MKIVRVISVVALLLPTFVTTPLTSARASEPSASGSYQFSLGDRYTKYVEFDARRLADGSATGHMFFSDEAGITYQDVDGTDDPPETYPGFYIRANFDGLVVNGNRAVMSGTVNDSNIRDLIGQRMLLTVEDNGDNFREPDKLTWGTYRPVNRQWTPSDAELERDPGVGLTWVATDAELESDPGVRMPKDETIGTQTFPFSAYAFVDTEDGVGDILVRP